MAFYCHSQVKMKTTANTENETQDHLYVKSPDSYNYSVEDTGETIDKLLPHLKGSQTSTGRKIHCLHTTFRL